MHSSVLIRYIDDTNVLCLISLITSATTKEVKETHGRIEVFLHVELLNTKQDFKL